MEPSWKQKLKEELSLPYMIQIQLLLEKERASHINIFPKESLILDAFWKTPFDKVKVIILGQDPYHGAGQADGLSFSVPKDVRPPPSLVNIFKELRSDLNIPIPKHGCLNSWAEQGVLLLNTVLTVQEGKAFSHRNIGWEKFTDKVISVLAENQQPLVFLLWGKAAESKCNSILANPKPNHLILKSPHPSPLSAHQGFFGSRPFSKINAFLESQMVPPINWSNQEL